MAASNPALEWWETDPESPGHLGRCEIRSAVPAGGCPELLHLRASGLTYKDVVVRPMFEVLSR